MIKLDGKTLNVEEFSYTVIPVFVETDEITSEGYVRNYFLFGSYRKFVLRCFEKKDVPWSESIVKYIEDKIRSGEGSFDLEIDESYYVFSGECYVLGFEAFFENEMRKFEIVLREA